MYKNSHNTANIVMTVGLSWDLTSLGWRYNEHDGVSSHHPHDCLLNRLFRRRSKKTLKVCVTGLCAGNSPVTGEFFAQRASNAENLSIWWRHHVYITTYGCLVSINGVQMQDTKALKSSQKLLNQIKKDRDCNFLVCNTNTDCLN